MKFNKILDYKKQVLSKAESRFLKAKLKERECLLKLNVAISEMNNMEFPKNGNISSITQELFMIELKRKDIHKLENELNLARSELAHFNHQFKKANLEFEKINFLHTDEVSKNIEKLKNIEAKKLDEFAIIGFNRRKK